MSDVYLAMRADGAFEMEAVAKVCSDDLGAYGKHHFRQELQILANLRHPNIARLLDGGVTNDGRMYIIMEHVDGTSLRELLIKNGALPIATVVEITKHICNGLIHSHKRGIIHLDIKPENIAIKEGDAGDQEVKILDFGISHRLGFDEPKYRGVIGTPAYMSPEQASGMERSSLDARSDIYSLGVIIYEMLTGERPFAGNPSDLISHHLQTPPISPRVRRPDLKISTSFERIVFRTLEKDRNNRQQTARELLQEMQKMDEGNPKKVFRFLS